MPAESPTLGLSHLQFEALLSAARESSNRYDFALVAMLGLVGLRIFEASGSDIHDVGEEHGGTRLRQADQAIGRGLRHRTAAHLRCAAGSRPEVRPTVGRADAGVGPLARAAYYR